MIGFYNLSVVLTYFGLCTSIFGMTLALSGHIQASVLCLLVCGLCDSFDGTIARKCKRSDSAKCFGVEIDSLCDLVCFGVFPAVLGYAVGAIGLWWTAALSLYVLAAVIRLGYFNVQEIERRQAGGGHRVYYEGLPVTSIALIAPVLLLLDTLVRNPWVRVYNCGLIAVAILFILRIKIRKPYRLGLIVLAGIGVAIYVLICVFGSELSKLYILS